ncbi:bud site selection protein 31, partial [Strigomonas culicis]
MPRIRPGMKKPPPGFEIVNEKLDEYEEDMKLALQEESNGVVGRTTTQQQGKRQRAAEAALSAAAKRTRADVDEENGGADPPPGDDRRPGDVKDEATLDEDKVNQQEGGEEGGESPVPPLWKIAKINYDRTRFVFDAYARKKAITKEVFDYCVEMQFIDGGLARRWRLPGYEKLCCTACGTPGGASIAAGITSRFALRDKSERKQKQQQQQQQQQGDGGESGDTAVCLCRVPA